MGAVRRWLRASERGFWPQRSPNKVNMDAQDAIDLARHAIVVSLLIGAPVLTVGMAVGLAVGLLQALTQIQDQTISFVVKIVAMIVTLAFTFPWLLQTMIDYSHELITNIPATILRG